MAARRLSSLLSHSLSAGSASKLLSQGAGKWYGSILCDIDYIPWPLVWQNITCLTYFLHQMVWQNITLLDSFFWISDLYKSSMEEKRKLQIPCLELRLPRIVLFRELNFCQTAGEWTIYPWIHSNCNSLSDDEQTSSRFNTRYSSRKVVLR
ncbi:uncharacterized protein LOC133717432 isoform X2 [Rosa rugosa]|uniref:uncharacterized protein LOC133717432 isoform X2 n=1 Tax=Rosa rugosa TaxID=74645 RepID=UPI002B414D0F|nr:uncharacterized protein LOC133717432 isoform X2 [Rosa rugosa]